MLDAEPVELIEEGLKLLGGFSHHNKVVSKEEEAHKGVEEAGANVGEFGAEAGFKAVDEQAEQEGGEGVALFDAALGFKHFAHLARLPHG